MRARTLIVALIAGTASAAPPPMPSPMPSPSPTPSPSPMPSPSPKPTSTTGVGMPSLPPDAKDLPVLTDDPVLGKASRVNGDETTGVVAFTFDDGPNPATTPAVIDALDKYDVPATFFIVTQRIGGKHGALARDVLARELASGYLIGSHSVTHPSLKTAAGDTITKEIDGSFRTLSHELGRAVGLFRPPYGALSGAGRVRLKKLGVTEVIWSIDTLDWRAHNEERLRKKVGSMIEHDKGGVVLMHDVKPITAKVIAGVLDDLEAANCKKLADGKDPIVPVSLHYFLRDGKTARAIPDAVQKRTEAYKSALPGRCAKRPASATSGMGTGKGTGTGGDLPPLK